MPLRRMGTDYVSAEHGTFYWGVALESQRYLERRRKSALDISSVPRNSTISSAIPMDILCLTEATRATADRTRFFAAHRWQSRLVLEEQSVSRQKFTGEPDSAHPRGS